MLNLIYKEFKIAVSPNILIFAFFGAMIIIPSYPTLAGFIYVTMAFPILFPIASENKDNYFTALLPVKKRDAVKARFLTVIIIQLFSLVFAIPFVFIYKHMYSTGNFTPVGLEANLAMYGSVFLVYGVENIFFFPMHYKTGRKLLFPIISCLSSSILLIAIIEGLTIAPLGINEMINQNIGLRVIIFVVGLILYSLLTYVSYIVSAKRFERVDL